MLLLITTIVNFNLYYYLTHTHTESAGVVVNVVAVGGWVVAGVLAIVVLVLIVVMWRQRRSGSKDMSDERTGNQPTE